MAAKIAVTQFPNDEICVCYTRTNSEHLDNERFIADCESWLGHPVRQLQSSEYSDIWDVFAKTRWLVGPAGARCTTELKKAVRQQFQEPWRDVQVFGFDSDECARAERFVQNNPDVCLYAPLIERNLRKQDCLALLKEAGIELPAMYKLGYRNNNCIGCVKGGAGYWNKIRKDFPEVFARMAATERSLNAAINKTSVAGKRVRVFLDELPENTGRYADEPAVECSLLCQETAAELLACDEEEPDGLGSAGGDSPSDGADRVGGKAGSGQGAQGEGGSAGAP